MANDDADGNDTEPCSTETVKSSTVAEELLEVIFTAEFVAVPKAE
jgi:hypothetical protein